MQCIRWYKNDTLKKYKFNHLQTTFLKIKLSFKVHNPAKAVLVFILILFCSLMDLLMYLKGYVKK